MVAYLKSKATGIWYVNHNQTEYKNVNYFFIFRMHRLIWKNIKEIFWNGYKKIECEADVNIVIKQNRRTNKIFLKDSIRR